LSAATSIEWTDVPGYLGYRVRRDGSLRGPSGKALAPMRDPRSGHLYVITGDRRKLRVHHAVLLAFVGPRPEGCIGRHLDDDSAYNHVSNLAWGTRLDNAADRLSNRGYTRGVARANARLTDEKVRAIREDRRPSRVVAAEYGVSHTAILRIRRGERWRAA
jgi:hypothetical protein